MKYLLLLLPVIAVVAYFAMSHGEPPIQRQSLAYSQPMEPPAMPEPAPIPEAFTASPPPIIPEPEPEPAPAEPEKHLAPEGVYYVLSRISVTTDSGVAGISPGTKVTMIKPGPPMRVTDGEHEFEATSSQLTNDLDVAAKAYRMESDQRAAFGATEDLRIGNARQMEWENRADGTASTEAARKKLEEEAGLARQQTEAAARERSEKVTPERAVTVTRATPQPMRAQRRK